MKTIYWFVTIVRSKYDGCFGFRDCLIRSSMSGLVLRCRIWALGDPSLGRRHLNLLKTETWGLDFVLESSCYELKFHRICEDKTGKKIREKKLPKKLRRQVQPICSCGGQAHGILQPSVIFTSVSMAQVQTLQVYRYFHWWPDCINLFSNEAWDPFASLKKRTPQWKKLSSMHGSSTNPNCQINC